MPVYPAYQLIDDLVVDLVFNSGPVGGYLYLQTVRNSKPSAFDKQSLTTTKPLYESMLQINYVPRLVEQLHSLGTIFDVLIRVPSSRSDAVPYFDAIKRAFSGSDWSERFTKNSGHFSALNPHMTNAAISYLSGNDELSVNSIMIVDESVSTGASVLAVVSRLRESGVRPDVAITVAAPLFFPREKTSHAKISEALE